MKRSSYGERDYAFGQRMLSLRTNIGLTQADLADQLGVSRRAVAEWEAGNTYPKVQHLKVLIALAMRTSAFAAGREEEEIRALWKAAHQKVRLDESWLFTLLKQPSSSPTPVLVEESGVLSWAALPLLLRPMGRRPPRQERVRRRVSRSQVEPLLAVAHEWIGGRRWKCPASMDERLNWLP